MYNITTMHLLCRWWENTSKTGVSCGALLTLRAVSEVSAVAQCPWWASIGWVVGFGGTRRTHKPIGFRGD